MDIFRKVWPTDQLTGGRINQLTGVGTGDAYSSEEEIFSKYPSVHVHVKCEWTQFWLKFSNFLWQVLDITKNIKRRIF